jgi:hypothetical protein
MLWQDSREWRGSPVRFGRWTPPAGGVMGAGGATDFNGRVAGAGYANGHRDRGTDGPRGSRTHTGTHRGTDGSRVAGPGRGHGAGSMGVRRVSVRGAVGRRERSVCMAIAGKCPPARDL